MSPLAIATLHVAACAAALLLGAAVAAAPKGTRRHKFTGRAYLASMLALNLSALASYRLNGRFNAFHWLALFSLATLAAGWWLGRRARLSRNHRDGHGYFMLWSYAGLLAAAASELAVRMPFIPRGGMAFAITVAGASVGVGIVAAVWIGRAMRRQPVRHSAP